MLRCLTTCSVFSILCLSIAPALSEDAVKSPTGKHVLQKCAEASGGMERLKGIKSLVVKGVAEIPEYGLKGDLTIHFREGDVRVDSEFNGQLTVQGVTKGKGWEWSPTGARLMSNVETQGLLASISMSQFVDPGKMYKSIVNVGKQEVDGQDCYHLKLTRTLDGGVEQMYVSTESWLPVRVITDKETAAGKVDVVTTLDEYQVFDGIKTATSSSSRLEKLGMTYKVKFSSYQHNQAIDDDIFDVPDQVKPLLEN